MIFSPRLVIIVASASSTVSSATGDGGSVAAAVVEHVPTSTFLRSGALGDRSLQSNGGCTDCIVDGVGYCTFQSYPDPSCLPNVCRCTPGEVDACTKNECQRDCAAQKKKLCFHDGNYFCAGDLFYDSTCMTNTCKCNDDGTVSCTKDAGDCVEECYTDDDCTTVVRSRSAQPDLYPLCGCESRSALGEIASAYDECLGVGVGSDSTGCASARCANSCQGYSAVCTADRKCDLIAPCAADVQSCPDGSTVKRNAANDCLFDPCPEVPSVAEFDPVTGTTTCKTDIQLCENGAAVDRDPDNGCEFRPCPTCSGEVFRCNDGSVVSRDSNANCAFKPCVDGTIMPDPDVNTAPVPPTVGVQAKLCFDSSGGNYLAPCMTSTASYCITEKFTDDDGCSCICANSIGQTKCEEACSDNIAPPPDSNNNSPTPPNDEVDESTANDDSTAPPPSDSGSSTPPIVEIDESTANDNTGSSLDRRCTCIGLGGVKFCPGDIYVAQDGCNECACSVYGIASCSKKACVASKSCTCEGDDGNTYCTGQTFLSIDGCNKCRCDESGAVSCTRMACPADDAQPKEIEEEVATNATDDTQSEEKEEEEDTTTNTTSDANAAEDGVTTSGSIPLFTQAFALLLIPSFGSLFGLHCMV